MQALGANEGKQTDGEHADDISLNEAAGSTEDESDSEDDIVLAELIERSNIMRNEAADSTEGERDSEDEIVLVELIEQRDIRVRARNSCRKRLY